MIACVKLIKLLLPVFIICSGRLFFCFGFLMNDFFFYTTLQLCANFLMHIVFKHCIFLLLNKCYAGFEKSFPGWG